MTIIDEEIVFIVFEDSHELHRESLLKTNVEQEIKSLDNNFEIYSLKSNGSKLTFFQIFCPLIKIILY